MPAPCLTRLHPVSFSELDKLTSAIQGEVISGTPRFYAFWANKIYLNPVPDTSSLEIRILYTGQHSLLTTSSTSFDAGLPQAYQTYVIDFILYRMYLKDQDPRANVQLQLWEAHKKSMIQTNQLRKRRDKFNVVQNEDNSITTVLGIN